MHCALFALWMRGDEPLSRLYMWDKKRRDIWRLYK